MSPRSLTPGYCLDKTHGLAYVRLSGRKHYLGPHGSDQSRQKYRELIAQWIKSGEVPLPAAISAGPPGADDAADMTIDELLARWWKHNRLRYGATGETDGKRPAGELGLFVDVFREMRRLFGGPEHKAISFGPKALKTLARHLASDRQYQSDGAIIVRRGLSRKVVNGQISKVKAVFRWAVEEELLPGEVFHRLEAVRGLARGEARDSEPTEAVSDAHVEAVLPFLSRHVSAMVQVQRLTGMRSSELVSMRHERIDRTGAGGKLWIYQLGIEHKTGHRGIVRQIELGPKAQAILKEFPKRTLDPDEYVFSPARAEEERREKMELARKTRADRGNSRGSNRLACPRRQPGKHYTAASYRRAIQRACDQAGIERWHPHQLRHSLATEIRRRFGADAAQVCLGHTSLDVTQLYAKADQELSARVMLEIG